MELAEADEWSIRKEAVQNVSAPVEMLIMRILLDESPWVRDAARESLAARTSNDWQIAVAGGLSLCQPIKTKSGAPQACLGDGLLAIGLNQVYQAIQGAELDLRLRSLSSKQPSTAQSVNPTSSRRHF